ncbi:MAG: PQQ-binding-like beta-propeller repeat protein [Candidatus Pacebacteria bacterium]|nr:PQQ-binding-like beta-propeller repeat protein [Candidatus Paceibacterota bacterium]
MQETIASMNTALPSQHELALSRVKEAIIKEVYVRGEDEPIGDASMGEMRRSGWLFDFRRALMRPAFMHDVSTLFWEAHQSRYPFQIGGLEIAAVPLVTGIAQQVYHAGKEDVTSFFIRKSRKKSGLLRMIEGTLMPGRPVILVDDIMNSGASFIRQVEVLEGLGYKVAEVWTILRFRDENYYTYFHERGIAVTSLFELNDFAAALKVQNMQRAARTPLVHPYRGIWKFASERANYSYVVAKSDPAIDNTHLYVGSDGGYFYALKLSDGTVSWSYKVGFPSKGKSIFSSPAVTDELVIFGAYDGNVYALDKRTGKKRWVFFDADFIGSSPAIAPELHLVFIGLEFGFFRRRGGIAAIDIRTGKRVWSDEHPAFTHATPYYIAKHREVAIGSNDGVARLYDAKTGKLLWKCALGDATEEELNAGFSRFDIKDSFVYDEKRDLLICGTMDGSLCAIERKTGKERFRFKAQFGIYSSPVLHRNTVIFNSLDKHTYCLNLDTFTEKWRTPAGARIFSAPVVIGDSVYIGANTGRVTELAIDTGEVRSYITLTERITNKIAYDPKTERFYIPTFANEIYCFERTH